MKQEILIIFVGVLVIVTIGESASISEKEVKLVGKRNHLLVSLCKFNEAFCNRLLKRQREQELQRRTEGLCAFLPAGWCDKRSNEVAKNGCDENGEDCNNEINGVDQTEERKTTNIEREEDDDTVDYEAIGRAVVGEILERGLDTYDGADDKRK